MAPAPKTPLLVLLAAFLSATVKGQSTSQDVPSSFVSLNNGNSSPATHPASSPAHCNPNYPRLTPSCAQGSNDTWCLEDKEYPASEIQAALNHHFAKVVSLYADVADLDTALSVERPETLEEETYLCPSETAYIRPLRVLSDCGWKIIVNNIKVNYQDFTQTTRVEECTTSGEACPLVPHCYKAKCLQKSAYHRFLVYNHYDKYFPFEIRNFKLPSSCACFINEFQL
ncbi:neurotrophin 1-like [Oratosquilla oratoria]|uniref:neurotrophin 1-like n=1 Tax=Oratosquilla oratoria TaxID=337810 RepID=UPI003F768D0A